MTLLPSVARLRARRRWVLPRTIRLRLTIVYGGLFLLCGTALLAITYLLVAHQSPAAGAAQVSGRAGGPGGLYVVSGRSGGCLRLNQTSPPTPGEIQRQFSQCLAQQQAAELNRLLTESGVALAIMTVASAGLGWLVAGRVLRPLRTITGAARSISASSLNARLALDGPDDELKELGDTFDGLLARLEAAFTAQRQFAANASHELRTPLARQRTLIEVALAGPAPTVPELREVCGRVLAAGQQQERLIEALLTLASSQRGLDRREPVDLSGVVTAAVRAQRADAERRGIRVDALVEPASAAGDSRLAERLVVNLLDNAVRYNQPGGWMTVRTGSAGGQATLSVTNSGPVISPTEVTRLFGPFQRRTADRTAGRSGAEGTGCGLGLSIVSAIAAAHGAWLWAYPRPGGGLSVQLRFPPREPAWPWISGWQHNA